MASVATNRRIEYDSGVVKVTPLRLNFPKVEESAL